MALLPYMKVMISVSHEPQSPKRGDDLITHDTSFPAGQDDVIQGQRVFLAIVDTQHKIDL